MGLSNPRSATTIESRRPGFDVTRARDVAETLTIREIYRRNART
jgi:hypothetical protein